MLGVPYTKFFLAAGNGLARLGGQCAFDRALLDAKMADVNLVKLSSIRPPKCEHIPPMRLPKGDLVPTAYARGDVTFGDFRPIGSKYLSSSVAVGIPTDPNEAGVIMEVSGFYPDEVSCEAEVCEMVMDEMNVRLRPVKTIMSISKSLSLDELSPLLPYGATFAAVVLLP